jgi:hypothetical protein
MKSLKRSVDILEGLSTGVNMDASALVRRFEKVAVTFFAPCALA